VGRLQSWLSGLGPVRLWRFGCLQLMIKGVKAGDSFEGTIDDPELLMEVTPGSAWPSAVVRSH
jgi:hypothetical protein